MWIVRKKVVRAEYTPFDPFSPALRTMSSIASPVPAIFYKWTVRTQFGKHWSLIEEGDMDHRDTSSLIILAPRRVSVFKSSSRLPPVTLWWRGILLFATGKLFGYTTLTPYHQGVEMRSWRCGPFCNFCITFYNVLGEIFSFFIICVCM